MKHLSQILGSKKPKAPAPTPEPDAPPAPAPDVTQEPAPTLGWNDEVEEVPSPTAHMSVTIDEDDLSSWDDNGGAPDPND